MVIFNSHVKLPEGIWHQCGCLRPYIKKMGLSPGDTSTLTYGPYPKPWCYPHSWMVMYVISWEKPIYKWDDDLGVPLWLRKPPYVSSATDETEWRWYQHVNGLEMKLNRYFDTGTLGGGFRTPKPDPMILCLHAHIVPTISSSHQGYVSTFGPHYSLYENIPYNFYHSSKLHKFEWFWVYVSPFVFFF